MSYKAGFVGLLGLPNAGKSTLVNALVGEKVSIVTDKPQTTRKRIVGILSKEDFQAVFVDSPGIIQATRGLNSFLEKEYKDILQESDLLMVVLNLDARKFEMLEEVIEMAQQSGKPWFAVINKEDQADPRRVVILQQKLMALNKSGLVGSALKKPEAMTAQIFEAIKELLPESPGPLYEPDLFTLANERELTAEIIREKCFENLHQEIPFGLAVRIIKFIENEGPIVKIYAELLIAKENHRPIVIGQKGQKLKQIGMEARTELEKFLDRKVFLDLHVKVQSNWSESDMIMKELGYVLPDQSQ